MPEGIPILLQMLQVKQNMITFAKMIINMGTQTRVQTVIRLRPEVFARLKFKAKQENLSLNAYVEKTLEEQTKPVLPKLPKDFEIDPVIASFSGMLREPTREEIESDPKLARIWRKHYETESIL